MRHYDFILAGGGAAGLSLAYQLARSSLKERSILIIDRVVKNRNDHTWCYWSREPLPTDALAHRTWEQVAFIGAGWQRVIPLAPYCYRVVRGIDFYRAMRAALEPLPNVDFLLGSVERIVDGPAQAEVMVNELTYTGDWVFDSRHASSEYRPLTARYHYLKQHFLGWEIETAEPAFDPQTPTLFDFRPPQRGAMRFFYVLPFTERRALVEYTLFSADLLPSAEYRAALQAYLREVLGIHEYRIVEEESDLIPMTDHPFPRRAGQRVMNIGTRGGRVKASTGYAFRRIQADAAAIVRSLNQHGHPFAVPAPPARYHLFDTLMLDVMARHGGRMSAIFTDLFRKNPVDRLFRFLDEAGPLRENVQVMASVPPGPFLMAWLHWVWAKGE